MKDLFKNNYVYCPLCNQHFMESDYLNSVFVDNKKALWLANMVTHYRHHHITSWNKCWGQYGYIYRSKWFGEYEDEKRKVNERAKRQIVRKATPFLSYHEISMNEFKLLQYNDEATLQLVEKKLTVN